MPEIIIPNVIKNNGNPRSTEGISLKSMKAQKIANTTIM